MALLHGAHSILRFWQIYDHLKELYCKERPEMRSEAPKSYQICNYFLNQKYFQVLRLKVNPQEDAHY